jgi:hypothetical protein
MCICTYVCVYLHMYTYVHIYTCVWDTLPLLSLFSLLSPSLSRPAPPPPPPPPFPDFLRWERTNLQSRQSIMARVTATYITKPKTLNRVSTIYIYHQRNSHPAAARERAWRVIDILDIHYYLLFHIHIVYRRGLQHYVYRK